MTELYSSRPSISATASSMGRVTWLSTSRATAPGKAAVMITRLRVMDGKPSRRAFKATRTAPETRDTTIRLASRRR